MKHYDSINRIQDDGTLLGEEVWAFNKLDGQNFCVKYIPKHKQFTGFGSRKREVDETDDQFGNTVKYFKNSKIPEILTNIIATNRGKKQIFNGVDEITFFFEWYGENSFAGFHQEGDELHLALIDVFLKKKGYIEPKSFYELFYNKEGLEVPEVIYRGKLTQEFISSIQNNDWNEENCQYPTIKEGVVVKRSTLLKGQRLPKVKIKTKWWINKLHNSFSEDKWKELE